MPEATPIDAAPVTESESFEALKQIAGRRTRPIPADLLARHALELPGTWDWPVRRAAFEAILRRLASARAQEIAVLERPRPGPWGRYVLGRPEVEGALVYDVRLAAGKPFRGSCDCADFLRGSLGLCKHLLTVVADLAGNNRAWRAVVGAPAAPLPRIVWEAATAATGRVDPLDAFGLTPPGGRGRPPAGSLVRLFRPAKAGPWRLATSHTGAPEARMRLVRALQDHVGAAGASADPAAVVVLAEERARLERIARLRAAAPRIEGALGRTKRRLYSYQKTGVARFFTEGRLVLADDMGLGKTTQAIAAAGALFDSGLVRRGLFVVPASLKPQWEREWHAVSDTPLRVVDGNATDRRAMYQSTRRGFLVTNYEQVVRDFDAIWAWAPDMVVLDEAQRIKNWATKTALTIKRLRPLYRLVLTGTPMENRIEELASIVEWVDDRALEPKWRLVPWHSAYADGKREVIGARNLDTLRARLAPVLLRRVRAEVLAQLPSRQDTTVPVDLSAEQRTAHDDLLQPIAVLAGKARRRPLTPPEFLKLMTLLATQRMIANGMAQLNFESTWPTIRGRAPTPPLIESLSSPKLLELRELVSSLVITQKRKVVVFSQWRRMLDLAAWAVSDLLATDGLRALFFTGHERGRRRTQNLVDFHDDPTAAMLFLSDAGGVGLNLQKAANACINLELPWNPAVLEQRIGRIHRIGQKRPIDVYNLVSRACIEERIASLVSDKRALFKGLFEGTTDQLRFDRSSALFAVLERIVEPAQLPPLSSQPSTRDEDESAVDPLVPEDTELPIAPAGGGVADVAQLFQALHVECAPDGGLRIEAPPHAAAALISMFEGMAKLLGGTSRTA